MSKPPMAGPRGRGPMGPRPKVKKETLPRVLKLLYTFYPKLIPIVVFCIIFAAIVNSIPAIFTKNILDIIAESLENGTTWAEALPELMPLIGILIGLYLISIILTVLQSQLMAYITQGFLSKMRCKMFDGMQSLPIKYFDTHKHGDIMSHYTNDIDTLRQLISQSIPSLMQAAIVVTTVLFIMLYYSVLMTLVVMLGVVAMFFVSKKIGGGSAKYFIRQQGCVSGIPHTFCTCTSVT